MEIGNLFRMLRLSAAEQAAKQELKRREKEAKLLQYAREVWGISCGETDEIIDKAIASTENFFRSLGVKTRLGEYGIGEDTIRTICSRFEARNWNLGENGIVTPQKVEEILRSRL